MGGEDFGLGAKHLNVPGLQYRVGVIKAETYWAASSEERLHFPAAHSSQFAPAAEQTIRIGIRSMTNLVIALMN